MVMDTPDTRPPAFVCDIDGTAADCSHREHHVRKQPRDWEAFYEGMDRDPPVEACLVVVQALIAQGITPIFLTGRPDRYMNHTRLWLVRHGFASQSGRDEVTTLLHMRPEGDHCPDDEMKSRIYTEDIQPRFRVVLWLEDRDRVVRMVREDLGLPCWQVREGNF